VIETLSDYYRVPEFVLGNVLGAESSGETGFFRFGTKTICYGQSASGVATRVEDAGHYDALKSILINGPDIHLPFNLTAIIENLRREHYVRNLAAGRESFITREWINAIYYSLRGILPVPMRRYMQRVYFSDWKRRLFPAWPVDFTVDNRHEELLALSMEAACVKRVPFIWYWPDGAPNCLILTHDVETSAGRDFTPQLMDLDDSYGLKASFQVVPEKRYEVPDEFVQKIRNRGFEYNIHDLNHDGNLYRQREEFLRRAKKINQYARRYNARGFRAGSMYRNLDWYDAYEFSYDMSVTNVAHLEPRRGGCCTVFPFFLGKILELPLTTSQDFSVFHILNDYSIDLWKKQVDLIRKKNGLMTFLTHPDYLISRRARKVYESLLDYLRQMVAREKVWAALPGDVDLWWRARSQMKLESRGNGWEIVGPGKERARLAYAVLDGGRLVYELAEVSSRENAVL
jgi:peptidoglycan/xylan/chitin deacetylase (PgdA/CDA1 family)